MPRECTCTSCVSGAECERGKTDVEVKGRKVRWWDVSSTLWKSGLCSECTGRRVPPVLFFFPRWRCGGSGRRSDGFPCSQYSDDAAHASCRESLRRKQRRYEHPIHSTRQRRVPDKQKPSVSCFIWGIKEQWGACGYGKSSTVRVVGLTVIYYRGTSTVRVGPCYSRYEQFHIQLHILTCTLDTAFNP